MFEILDSDWLCDEVTSITTFLCPGKSNSCTYRVAKHAEYKQACAPKTVLTRYGKYFFSTEYCLRVFFEDVSTDKKSSIFDLLRPHQEFSEKQTKLVGKVVQRNSSPF